MSETISPQENMVENNFRENDHDDSPSDEIEKNEVSNRGIFEDIEQNKSIPEDMKNKLKSHLIDVDQDRAKTENTLKEAQIDEVTKLPNRESFFARAKDLVERARRNNIDPSSRQKTVILIGIIDLNRFKQVNDNLGHNKGDEILLKFSQILLENTRGMDLVGRTGGDEFAILASFTQDNQDEDNARRLSVISRKVRSRLEDSLSNVKVTGTNLETGDQDERSVSASVGIVADTPSSEDSEDFLRNIINQADQEMYQLKRSR